MSTERVLIVEDEQIVALDLEQRLARSGYHVVDIAASGRAALEVIDARGADAVLMDIRLEGEMDGIDTAKAITDRYRIPVIFLTAFADESTLERAKEAAPAGYVSKPFKERELLFALGLALYKSTLTETLRRQERWTAACLRSAGDGIIAADGSGAVHLVNPAALDLLGLSESDARGRRLDSVLTLIDERDGSPVALPCPDDAEEVAVFDRVCLVGGRGAKIAVEGTLARVREGDTLLGTVVTVRDVRNIRDMSARISYRDSHDTLTGLLNREALFRRMAGLVEAPSDSASHCFVFVDIDRFRVVNDVCGHVAGDELLREAAAAIAEALPREAWVGRLGGDEFGVVLPRAGVVEGRIVGVQIVRALYRSFGWGNHNLMITASAGVVAVATPEEQAEALAAADEACRLAKEEGGNRVRVYESSHTHFRRRRGEMKWIPLLTQALDENRFRLYYQPITPLQPAMGLPHKIELLVRLVERDGTLVMPSTFISAAERYNLMPALDRWVIREGIAAHRRFSAAGKRPSVFCINLSAASLTHDSLLDYITSQFFKQSAEPSAFCFEITESAAIENLGRAAAFIKNLKGIGCTFALDDFGNGFSSFAYLKTLPVDYLKIDGSYVKDIAQDPIDYALVDSVNRIGHVIGMQTIAEFVHSQEVHATLVHIGVDFAQGYAVAPPAPLDDSVKFP